MLLQSKSLWIGGSANVSLGIPTDLAGSEFSFWRHLGDQTMTL
jgi:hypothetical protein